MTAPHCRTAALVAWLGCLVPAGPCLAADGPAPWAFRKPARPVVPAVAQPQRVRTPIDAFVLHRLEARGLTFAADAGRLVLLRRACFDLTGLPPSPEEARAFLEDTAPDAYERLLDRLLASPHYGERWGRHWLDAAGYADTIKSDNEINGATIREGMWRYRDYVVRAFNADKPYDRFVLEQLAGDELVDRCAERELSEESKELLIATGFWRTAIDGTNNFERNRPMERYQVLHDTLATFSTNLLGLTVGCARCHDHKYDPIAQKDYYRLMACLTPAYNPQHWLMPQDRQIIDATDAEKEEVRRFNEALDRQVGELGGRLGKLRRDTEQRLVETKYATLPDKLRTPLRQALAVSEAKRSLYQRFLVATLGSDVQVTPEDVARVFTDAERRAIEELEDQIADLRARRRSIGKIQALFDVGPVPATHLLQRGNHETPGPEVEAGLPGIFGGQQFTGAPRLALARALTERDSLAAGLLARVWVNRAWHHHFGRGIVATPGNLGSSGAAPTHPELLDWLATEFMNDGWNMKRLHQRIMTSTVYRQAAEAEPQAADPDNLLLWKMRLRRLESEVIRDAILAVSGKLDRTVGGPPILLEGRPDGTIVVARHGLPTPTSGNRRSLYLLARRNFGLSFLAVFDQPLMATSCTCRGTSAVVSQSLAMLNDPFVHEQAEVFAGRVAATAGAAPEDRVRSAFRIALARLPSPAETAWGAELLRRQTERHQDEAKALTHLCQMLLNTNEFLYVE